MEHKHLMKKGFKPRTLPEANDVGHFHFFDTQGEGAKADFLFCPDKPPTPIIDPNHDELIRPKPNP